MCTIKLFILYINKKIKEKEKEVEVEEKKQQDEKNSILIRRKKKLKKERNKFCFHLGHVLLYYEMRYICFFMFDDDG
jgi:hypothetical protein